MGFSCRPSEETVRSYYEEHSHIERATSSSQVFKSSKMNPKFDPAKVKLPRECRDSAANPNSVGIILAEDETGSMSNYILNLIQKQFPRLIKKIPEVVSFDPHIMFMGVGDVVYDDAPLQVTQFETDLKMIDQLQEIWLEGGGGPNSFESYILPWYFAGKHISMDCYEKRGQKGFLFTFGDEEPTPSLSKREIDSVFGKNDSLDSPSITKYDCLEMASQKFNCYHIMLPGSNRSSRAKTLWKDLMGGHACNLTDHEYLTELVTTILKMYEGKSKTEALNELSGDAKRVVSHALEDHEERVESTIAQVETAEIEEF